MSRVPVDTVIARLAVAALLALPLAGCGGDDEPTADTASTPTAPSTIGTSPLTTPPADDRSVTPADDAKTKQSEPEEDTTASQAEAPTDEDVPAIAPAADTPAVRKASAKKQDNRELATDIKKIHAALKSEGLDPGKPIVSGDSSGALQIKETTIVFYPSPRLAAQASAQFKEALKQSPQHVEIARKANRLYMLSLPTRPSDEQLELFEQVREIADDAV